MATKNLGIVKAIFRQSTAPFRTDVLWYDTTNSILRYYDAVSLSWASLGTGGYIQLTCPWDNATSIPIGSVDSVVGITLEFAAYRNGFRMSGTLRALFYGGAGVDPYTFETWINEDSNVPGVAFTVTNDGTTFSLVVSVDDSIPYDFVSSYKMDIQSMTNLPSPTPAPL